MSEETEARYFPAQVASIENKTTIVINRGEDDGVNLDEIYLIYREGKEIIDPETKESLGALEVVLGKGKVVHVQPKMSTLESANYSIIARSNRTVTEEENNLSRLMGLGGARVKKTTYTEPEKEQQPFKDVQIGDFVKPI